ncbi:type I-MYXAN CRISPR-associated protein Cas6/Cmx6 [Nostoc linckia FACHB-104]|nr:type I-MYXAN CRISPR-associated protein Cas6/Cmx6 [Nostoc linckia FACHB-104]
MTQFPYVDLSFSIIGHTLPIDHGYELYAALTHLQSKLHSLDDLSIQTIPGIPDGNGSLRLNDHSRLRIRLPVDKIPLVYPFAGKSLTIGKHKIRLDIPQIYVLRAVEELRSRIVVIKGYEEPETFLKAAQRQIKKLGIQGTPSIPINANGKPKLRTIKIKQFKVVGFSLEVTNLCNEDSLSLQIHGIGGKQKMGCGVFVPSKEKQ